MEEVADARLHGHLPGGTQCLGTEHPEHAVDGSEGDPGDGEKRRAEERGERRRGVDAKRGTPRPTRRVAVSRRLTM